MLIAMAAITLSAAPAFAQDQHKGDHPQPGASTGMDMSKMTPEEMHRHCAAIMGGRMQSAPKHDHSSDKLGHAPTYKAPSDAEMKAMHDQCAAMMAKRNRRSAPTKP
jgi:hypothetical protein